jgi:tight adherence protein C
VTRSLVLAVAAAVLAAAGVVELAATGWRTRDAGRTGEQSATGGRGGWGGAIAALARLGRRVGAPLPAGDLAARIEAAGAPLGLSAPDVTALKAGTALAALLAALALGVALPGRLGLLGLVAAPAGGFLGPDLWLRRHARRRAEAMGAELADVLDLLRVAVEAGLAPVRALSDVGRRHGGQLAGELRAVAERVALGVPREEALQTLARRCPLPHVAALTAALARADRHGAPLAPALHALAADARADRARILQERAARAAPKIQLVVALLLVPSVMLLVAAALVDALVV